MIQVYVAPIDDADVGKIIEYTGRRIIDIQMVRYPKAR
jgi:hypothetical protein